MQKVRRDRRKKVEATQEEIDKEIALSLQFGSLPEDEFRCRTCKKAKLLEYRSKENRERCASCNGDG